MYWKYEWINLFNKGHSKWELFIFYLRFKAGRLIGNIKGKWNSDLDHMISFFFLNLKWNVKEHPNNWNIGFNKEETIRIGRIIIVKVQ